MIGFDARAKGIILSSPFAYQQAVVSRIDVDPPVLWMTVIVGAEQVTVLAPGSPHPPWVGRFRITLGPEVAEVTIGTDGSWTWHAVPQEGT